MTDPNETLAYARDRAMTGQIKLGEYEVRLVNENWQGAEDRAKKARNRFEEAAEESEKLRWHAEQMLNGGTEPEPEPGPGEYFHFDLGEHLPFAPFHRKDLRNCHIPAPSGTVEAIHLEIELEGTPDSPELVNRIISFGNAKGDGTYEHPRNFTYLIWKKGSATLRTGWNVKHSNKTKDSIDMDFPGTSTGLATYSHQAAFTDLVGQDQSTLQQSKVASNPIGDLPPVIGNHGAAIRLSGHGDSDTEVNENETAIVGVSFHKVTGWIKYVS